MRFDSQPLANPDKTQWSWIGAVSLGDAGAPIVVEANGNEVRLASGARFPFPGGTGHSSPTPEGIVPIDFNYDFKTDLVLAGAGGVRFFRQDSPSTFTDVTALTKLPASVLNGRYTGAWAVDIEADGDLDLVLGSATGAPTVLRNNGDGTFTVTSPFNGVSGVRGFVWADLNGDGNPDATFIDGDGHLRVFDNQRSGNFSEIPLPASGGQVQSSRRSGYKSPRSAGPAGCPVGWRYSSPGGKARCQRLGFRGGCASSRCIQLPRRRGPSACRRPG